MLFQQPLLYFWYGKSCASLALFGNDSCSNPALEVKHFNKETFKNLGTCLGRKKYNIQAYLLVHQKKKSSAMKLLQTGLFSVPLPSKTLAIRLRCALWVWG